MGGALGDDLDQAAQGQDSGGKEEAPDGKAETLPGVVIREGVVRDIGELRAPATGWGGREGLPWKTPKGT